MLASVLANLEATVTGIRRRRFLAPELSESLASLLASAGLVRWDVDVRRRLGLGRIDLTLSTERQQR